LRAQAAAEGPAPQRIFPVRLNYSVQRLLSDFNLRAEKKASGAKVQSIRHRFAEDAAAPVGIRARGFAPRREVGLFGADEFLLGHTVLLRPAGTPLMASATSRV